MFIMRIDFDTRRVDTVAKLNVGVTRLFTKRANGSSTENLPMPFPFYDDAVVTTDGSIAILHAREYRLEWMGGDGRRVAGSRLTYPWQRITDDDRQRLVDSVNGSRQHSYDSLMAKRAADSLRDGHGPTTTTTYHERDGTSTITHPPMPPIALPVMIGARDVPDFRPPTGPHPMLADGDDNIWIRTLAAQSEPGFVVWDVINRASQLVDRVRVPENRAIAGFAPGVVYLVAGDGGMARIEKTQVATGARSPGR